MSYLKASAHEKMYSDYLQAAREAEKEEVMDLPVATLLLTQASPRQ